MLSQFPLPGVNVQFINGDFTNGVATDMNGNFKIENVVFAGSGTQPGVGVPMVLISGRLAAERIVGPVK